MSKGPAEIAHGPMLIGFIFNILLYGIMITQLYIYFVTYKTDKMWMKIFVVVLFVADTANAVFDFVYLYESLIMHFTDVAFLADADWVFATDPALTAIIASLVQLFFAYRVMVLVKNMWIVGVVVFCAVAGGVSGIVTSFEVGITPYFVDFRHFQSVVIIWLVSESVGDLVITSTLVWYLKQKRGFQASDELIDRLIRALVQTGLLTSLCATLDLIFFLTDPTGTHLIFNFPLSKLYTNSLMSSLNSRGNWDFTSTSSKPCNRISAPSTLHVDDQDKTSELVPFPNKPGVFVHVESHEVRDIEGDISMSPSSCEIKSVNDMV